ncbi:MAG: thioredoxin reductase/Pyruvate/2-oxoacid:ferredoxin oxidoreductase delta subunit [Planctomycetota bacterium]|jgi:thioredoxin reductase/Pyruvate/2-oxoacid:ferredoxin oxidoreductase delta subunit
MTWGVLSLLLLGLSLALSSALLRRKELRSMAAGHAQRQVARERGSDRARLQYPAIDGSRCIGCGVCVAACPEEGVLDILHGQAVVVHGARCLGHGRCAEECPVGAIALTLGDLSHRHDLPVLDEGLESPHAPGLFLAGEVTGFALIRTAIAHGSAIAREVGRRLSPSTENNDVLDLCIVGAGPAGIACALQARELGLNFQVLERDTLGGTVAHYPRGKLVMTQPAELPLYGSMQRETWSKEELIELWVDLAQEHELPIEENVTFEGVVRHADGHFEVRSSRPPLQARHVCLALGRRGIPRKLGVPGEELLHVAYSLVDARSFVDRRILVVGGGDSAVEAALGLAKQSGNQVLLSYRKDSFSRIKARNEAHLQEALKEGQLSLLLGSQVVHIHPQQVEFEVNTSAGCERQARPFDDVFIMVGGVPPFKLLEDCGVSFDPEERAQEAAPRSGDPSLLRTLIIASVSALVMAAWVGFYWNYYVLPLHERPAHQLHGFLRPSRDWGLGFGIAGVVCILANLCYLLRRVPGLPLRWGSPRAWMTSHVVTGLLALMLALLHSGMAPRDSVGGHALIGLVVIIITGAIGRYLYAFVPRATMGRELALDEVRDRVLRLAGEWEREHQAFGERARTAVHELVERERWKRTLVHRLLGILHQRRALKDCLGDLAREGLGSGVPEAQVRRVIALARRAHRMALMAARYEDLRSMMSTWRYIHRWAAVLMVLLVIVHVISALRFGHLFGGGS